MKKTKILFIFCLACGIFYNSWMSKAVFSFEHFSKAKTVKPACGTEKRIAYICSKGPDSVDREKLAELKKKKRPKGLEPIPYIFSNACSNCINTGEHTLLPLKSSYSPEPFFQKKGRSPPRGIS